MGHDEIKELVAIEVYLASYIQYGHPREAEHWRQASEEQRQLCRAQANAAMVRLEELGVLRV